jgi:DNA-binding Xre family transcriptional regulator
MKKLKFRLRELMAERTRKTGEPCTYRIIYNATGVSPNTLSAMAQGRMKMVGISVLERLLEYFDCEVGDLMVYEEVQQLL